MNVFQPSGTASAPLLRGLLSEWWPWYKDNEGLADTTCHAKEGEMRTDILPAFGDMSVSDITSDILKDYRDKLLTRLSPGTVICVFKIWRPAMQYAVKKGYISQNPVSEVKMPKVPYREIEVFTAAEVSKLIASARPLWFADMVLLAYRTGMRRGELYGLKWEDVNFEDKFLMVRRTIEAYEPRQRLIHPPKTHASARRIKLDNVSLQMLVAREKAAKTEWIFESRTGAELSPWNCTRYMHNSCVLAGIRPRCFHALRHTHATLLLSKGIHPKIVQERLGHARIETTLGTYSHVLPTMQGIVVDALNKIQ